MRRLIQSVVIVALILLHGMALWALLHPRVTREYRAFYMDRTSVDLRPPRYHATPQEGVTLSREALPDFVDFTFGMSVPESFGRWTDTSHGLRAGLQLNQPVSGRICLQFRASPSIAARGRHFSVGLGSQQKDLVLNQAGFETVNLDLSLKHPEDTVEFRFPGPMPKASETDGRELGIGVAWIRWSPQPCSSLPSSSQ